VPYKGLVCDYGGVLTSSVTESFADFCRAEDIDVELFRHAVLGAARTDDSLFARVETGTITQEEFDTALATLLTDSCGKTIASDSLKQRLFATMKQDLRMQDAVAFARAQGIRTALVSNSWGGRDYPADVLERLFDVVLISGEIGLRKPDPAIYARAASELQLEPSECVFVDDFRVNVEGAEAVGMAGILHRATEETLKKLEGFLPLNFLDDAADPAG
jgi:putative hydrolase of the HAD superfamily